MTKNTGGYDTQGQNDNLALVCTGDIRTKKEQSKVFHVISQ